MVRLTGESAQSGIKPYNYSPGDIINSSHTQIQTEPVAQGEEITAGHIYTKNGDGFIVAPVVRGGIAQLSNGRFQARGTWTVSRFPPGKKTASADTADGQRRLSFLVPPSHIVLRAEANVSINQLVDLNTPTTTTVEQDRVKPNSEDVTNSGTVGRCLEIIERLKAKRSVGIEHEDREHRMTTDAGDTIEVEMTP